MKLSEAIRLGAMMKPQGIGGRMDGETRCALAGASDALGIEARRHLSCVPRVDYEALRARYPILDAPVEAMPVSDNSGYGWTLLSAIWALNDNYEWTRERIADWVQSIEDGLSPAAGEATKVESESVSVGELIAR